MKLRKKSFSRHQKLDLSTFKGRTTILQYLISTTLSLSLSMLPSFVFQHDSRSRLYGIHTYIYIYSYYYAVHNIEGFFLSFQWWGLFCFCFNFLIHFDFSV
jgi:hypothetical protein